MTIAMVTQVSTFSVEAISLAVNTKFTCVNKYVYVHVMYEYNNRVNCLLTVTAGFKGSTIQAQDRLV